MQISSFRWPERITKHNIEMKIDYWSWLINTIWGLKHFSYLWKSTAFEESHYSETVQRIGDKVKYLLSELVNSSMGRKLTMGKHKKWAGTPLTRNTESTLDEFNRISKKMKKRIKQPSRYQFWLGTCEIASTGCLYNPFYFRELITLLQTF